MTQLVNNKREAAWKLASKILRWTILGSLLLFVLSATTLHVLGVVAPSIHAICPYGGLETMLSFITFGAFVKKIFLGTFVLFFVTIGLAVIMRRSFCGQLCAFGALQEFFGKLGRKLFKKRPVLPQKLDRVFRYLKFAVLAVTVVMAWLTAQLWITPYDPFNALGHLADFNALITTYLIGFIVLIVIVLGSIIFDRFFCKYLCPAGALYAAIGKASPYAVRIHNDKCIECGLCNKACPMNVDVMNSKKEKITDMECINCNACVLACPSEGALTTGFSRKKAVRPLIATLIALAVFFVPIGIAAATGSMQILPNKYTRVESSISTHEDEETQAISPGGISASDLKGSMTLADTAAALGMPLVEVYEKLGLPNDYPQSSTIKSAAASMGEGFGEFKHRLIP